MVRVVTEAQDCVAAGGQGRRVLFVNADTDLRAVVTRVLEGERFRVTAVAHSGHALLVCRTQPFDVAIVELSGPDVSGPTLVEQLRRHQSNLTTIYLGNPGSPEGVEHLLVRPFTKDDLVEQIELALSGVAA
jgi:two-component system cell cycle sensor histidine kinase/response regulator CckA